jgi:Skp family chaperone for outer membrane proteins
MSDALTGFATTGEINGLGFDLTWEDRPEVILPWFDREQRRLMVVEMYHIENQTWQRDVFFAGGELESTPSPYLDDNKRPMNPIEAYSSYVDRMNRRVGIVRDMRPIQDEVNMRRSKALHEMNTRQVQQVDPSAPQVDVNSVREEAAKPDGVIPPGWTVVARSDVVANNLTLLAEAKAEIERFSPNPAILGRQGADASGRSQQIRQQAGMTELARVLGRFNDWEFRCYHQMWGRARQFWKDPKWVRVTDDTGAPQYVRVNDPVHAMDPVTGQKVIDQTTQQPVLSHKNNDIAKMDIDIIVDSVPDTATLEQEIFEELAQLAQTYGPQNVPFSLVIEMSSLPKKRELIQKLQAFQAEQQQAQAAALQQKMATEGAADAASTASDLATARNKNAQALLYEVQAVVKALEGHIAATEAAAAQAMNLPVITLDPSSPPSPPIQPPPGGPSVASPPPGPTGVSGSQSVN